MLVNVGVALPGVSEPDVGSVDGREVGNVGGNLAGLGLEPGVSASARQSEAAGPLLKLEQRGSSEGKGEAGRGGAAEVQAS